MHRHHKVLPLVKSGANQLRSAAVAVKPKPHPPYDAASENKGNLRKWPPMIVEGVQRTSRPNESSANLPTSHGNTQGQFFPNFPTSPRQHREPPHNSDGPKGTHTRYERPQGGMGARKPAQRSPPSHNSRSEHPSGQKPFDHQHPYHSNEPLYQRAQPFSPDTEASPSRQWGAAPSQKLFKPKGSPLDGRLRASLDYSTSNESRQKVSRRKIGVAKEVTMSPDVYIPTTISVGNLARLLGVRLEVLQKKMTQVGMLAESNYDHVLSSDYAALIAEELGRNAIISDEDSFDLYPPLPHPNPTNMPFRPPIVTIMGHVDHGKTTLLDTLRSTSVAKGEAGGITQHIGAFSVPVKATTCAGIRSITFLDTPGHAAFSAIRARGANVTDIIVLVVAADDGIMPQTREVIDLIKKDRGNTSVIIAINKVDKPGVDVDAVQKRLLAEGLQLEVFGGDVPSVEVSGLTGQGLPTLIETISAVAELQDIRAERSGFIYGHILESKVQKGLGPVATVLVMHGCLELGAHLISGTHHAKVRLMRDSSDAVIKIAYPGMAVTVSGWKSLPSVGDDVLQGSEAEIKKAIANRERRQGIKALIIDAEAINTARNQERKERGRENAAHPDLTSVPRVEGRKELRIIVKADVSGSAEAVRGALQGIGNKDAQTKIVASGVGDVCESDVTMAKAIDATIVAFSVSVPRSIEILASQSQVPICSSNVIYRLMDDIKSRIIALLPVLIETKVTGEATVLQLFDIHLKSKQMMKVAGCRVTNGVVEKSKSARVVRDGQVIHDGPLETMKILKKDVIEVRKGSECGLRFADFDGLHEGDLIQMYQKIEKPGVL